VATEIYMMKTARGLQPYEAQDIEDFDRLEFNKVYKGVFTVPRSSPQNRWFHACLHLLFKQQDTWPTFTLFRDAIKRALGLVIVHDVKGKHYYEYPSLAFDKMDQADFSDLCNRFVKLVCERIIPNMPEQGARAMLDLLDGDTGKQGERVA